LTRNSVVSNYCFVFMSNEFELNEDFDFDEDFSDDLADFDDFNEDNVEDLLMRTAVLQKNNMVALLCIKSATAGAAICRVDPREANPAVQIYDDPTAALEWFTKSLRTSRKNGWTIVYDGLPLQG
jgi:hypothetical protein